MNLIDRICKSYKYSVDNGHDNINVDSMWGHWIRPKYKDVLNSCYNNEIENTHYNILHPDKSYLCFGFENNHCTFDSFENLIEHRNSIKTCLIKLCTSLGLLRLFNPEGGESPNLYNINFDIETLLLQLDEYFGFKIDFPNIFEVDEIFNWLFYINYYPDLEDSGIKTKEQAEYHYNNYGKKEGRKANGHEKGIYTSRGLMTDRCVHALHFLSRIKETLKNNIVNSTILEIGGGLGRNAYYAKKLGVKKYIIIDIPSSYISSSYYLGKTLGEENISLLGENTNNYLHISPPENYNHFSNIDLIVQFDGLTEMGRDNSEKYINSFIKLSPLFLSINHEANKYTVNDLYHKNTNITCIYRFQSWYRNGYIEELLSRKI